MVAISKAEAKIVREQFPWVHMRRTVNKYYMEEDRKALQMLRMADKEMTQRMPKRTSNSKGAGRRA